MKDNKLGRIKNVSSIYRKGNYVVLVGRSLYIFTVFGELIVHRSDIRFAWKIAFIGYEYLLIDTNRFYFLISLKDGTDVWKVRHNAENISLHKFAVSKNNSFAYDCYSKKFSTCLVKINLSTGVLSEVDFIPTLRATRDIICDYDEDETPCLLQMHYCKISDEQISENGILYQHQDIVRLGSTFYWKAKWIYAETRIAHAFFCNPDTVITNDLLIHNVRTGEQFCLIENEANWTPPENSFHTCVPEMDRGYVVLIYDTCNVVVDLSKRKVIACYASDYIARGCIIDDQYWIGTNNGVQRKPFPIMEDIPPKPNMTYF